MFLLQSAENPIPSPAQSPAEAAREGEKPQLNSQGAPPSLRGQNSSFVWELFDKTLCRGKSGLLQGAGFFLPKVVGHGPASLILPWWEQLLVGRTTNGSATTLQGQTLPCSASLSFLKPALLSPAPQFPSQTPRGVSRVVCAVPDTGQEQQEQ